MDKSGVLTTTVEELRRAKGVRSVTGELLEDGETTVVRVTTALLPFASLWVVAQTAEKLTAPLQKVLQAEETPFEMRLTFVAAPPAQTRELTRSIHGGLRTVGAR